MSRETRFAIFVYDDVEPIDLGATFGVLSMARRIAPSISMFTVAHEKGPVRLTNGLVVMADHGFTDCPEADVLVISGGPGWPEQAETPAVLDFIRRAEKTTVIASVCTGGMILAAAGLLDGRRATTKRHVAGGETSPLRTLAESYPRVDTLEAAVVDQGNIITGGGVTLAMDTMLYLLVRFFGKSVAVETARIMDYETAWRANEKAFKTAPGTN